MFIVSGILLQGQPRLEEITDDCQYVFEWATNAACLDSVDVTNVCKFTDPQTETVFDLSPLTKKASDSQGYVVRICRHFLFLWLFQKKKGGGGGHRPNYFLKPPASQIELGDNPQIEIGDDPPSPKLK